MKSKHIVFGILALAIIIIVFIIFINLIQQGRLSGSGCPQCPTPNLWSECSEQGLKIRTNYRCGTETNYTCQSYNETKACPTEIILKSGALEALISPTADEKVKGIIKVEATKVPSGTTVVAIILTPQGTQQLSQDMPNTLIVRDSQATDGWKVLLDTTKVANGIYTIFVGASYEGAPDADPWLDETSTQVMVKN